MSRPVVLLTDFGTRDPFAGIMKCAIHRHAPRSTVIDLSHDIPPQDVRAAVVVLEDSLPHLPDDAVVCVVVDPGVGTGRRALLAVSGTRTFIAPDNGVLTPVLQGSGVSLRTIAAFGPIAPDRSATFHGRDVFAPAAALVARGDDHLRFTTPFEGSPVTAPLPEVRPEGSALRLTIVGTDRFGNCATNLRRSEAEPWVTTEPVRMSIGREHVAGLSRTYADVPPERPVLYFDSAGRLAIGVNGGSAAQRFSLSPGAEVLLERGD